MAMRPTPRLQQAGYTFSECINIQLPFTLWYRKRPMTGDLSRQISRMFIYMSEVHIVFDKTWQLLESRKLIQFFWPFNGHIKTAEQQTTIQQYGDWYTGRCWVGCYIWYSEEGTGRGRRVHLKPVSELSNTLEPLKLFYMFGPLTAM